MQHQSKACRSDEDKTAALILSLHFTDEEEQKVQIPAPKVNTPKAGVLNKAMCICSVIMAYFSIGHNGRWPKKCSLNAKNV